MKKLEYKILASNKNVYLDIPLDLTFNPMDNSDLVDDFIQSETNKALNKIDDVELQSYLPKNQTTSLDFEFKFYDNTLSPNFNSDWINSGFDTSTNYRTKNSFKKSLFLLNFYNGNDSNTNVILFNITIPTITSTPTTNAIYSFSSDISEGYLLYYLRDRNLINSTGNTIYMKASFLNAKTGKVTNFANLSSDNTIAVDNFTDEMNYFPVKFYNNYNYEYLDNSNNPTNSLTLRELKLI